MLFVITDIEGKKTLWLPLHVIKKSKGFVRAVSLSDDFVNNFTELLISLTFAVPIVQEDGGGGEEEKKVDV